MLRENFFYEGDVSDVSSLIEVDIDFVLNCVKLIEQVSIEMRNEFTNYCL